MQRATHSSGRFKLAQCPILGSLLLAMLGVCPAPLSADTISRTDASSCRNLLEVFIEGEQLRVELEISEAAAADFAPLSSLDHRAELAEFTQQHLNFQSDSASLPGRLESRSRRPQSVRDPITGQPTAATRGVAWHLRWSYSFPADSRFLRIPAPLQGSVELGLRVYHEGIAINDFGLLSSPQTVRLDREDPWYSHFVFDAQQTGAFRGPQFDRSLMQPLTMFLCTDHHEVRLEALIRVATLLEDRSLPAEIAAGLTDFASEGGLAQVRASVHRWFRERYTLAFDAIPATDSVDVVHFVERGFDRTRRVTTPTTLDPRSCIVGITQSHWRLETPSVITLSAGFFPPRQHRIAVTLSAGDALDSDSLSPEHSHIDWSPPAMTYDRLAPVNAELRPPEAFSATTIFALALLSLGLFAAGTLLWRNGELPRQRSRVVSIAGTSMLLVAIVVTATLSYKRLLQPQKGQSTDDSSTSPHRHHIADITLQGVYQCLAIRDERLLYDRLREFVTHRHLEQTYAALHQAIHGDSGATFRVDQLTLDSCETQQQRAPHSAWSGSLAWSVQGEVGHWGHAHRQQQRFRAEATFAIEDGVWKLDLLRRIEPRP